MHLPKSAFSGMSWLFDSGELTLQSAWIAFSSSDKSEYWFTSGNGEPTGKMNLGSEANRTICTLFLVTVKARSTQSDQVCELHRRVNSNAASVFSSVAATRLGKVPDSTLIVGRLTECAKVATRLITDNHSVGPHSVSFDAFYAAI